MGRGPQEVRDDGSVNVRTTQLQHEVPSGASAAPTHSSCTFPPSIMYSYTSSPVRILQSSIVTSALLQNPFKIYREFYLKISGEA